MITLITGAPGAGKTAALVDLLQGVAKSGRQIWLDVLKDGPHAGKGCVPDLQLEHQLFVDAHQWHEPGVLPDGAAVVLDEVQRLWPPAPAGSRKPPDIAALELHRHRGFDFFIITQHPGLLHANVRALVGRHVHLRDVGLLGRWWYEWPEATDVKTFRSAPVKKRYTLSKRALGTYTSASVHIKPIRSVPRTVLLVAVAVVVLVGLVWRVVASIGGRTQAVQATPAPAGAASRPAALPPAGVRAGVGSAQRDSGPRDPEEPYKDLPMHVVGQVGDVVYVSVTVPDQASRPVAYLNSRQLLAAGYAIRVDAPCAVRLIRGKFERRLTCDQPLIAAAPARGPAGLVGTAAAGVVSSPSVAASAPI